MKNTIDSKPSLSIGALLEDGGSKIKAFLDDKGSRVGGNLDNFQHNRSHGRLNGP